MARLLPVIHFFIDRFFLTFICNKYRVFSGISYGLKFVGTGGEAASRSLGQISLVSDAHSIKYLSVRFFGSLIEILMSGFVDIEGVQVFHDKFSGAHNTAFGPGFISEFGLELIDGK